MNVNWNMAQFVRSAAKPSDFPRDGLPQVVFAGRSNVGKSSVINRLLNRKNFARVGSAPGKTTHINYFLIDQKLYLVDLPGYGYAKVSKGMSKDWGPMMEEYFQKRQGLKKVIQLVDIRHAPSAQDIQMYEYLRHYGLDGIVVATKADKVSKNEMQKCVSVIRKTLNLSVNDMVIPVSALKRTGQDKLLEEMEKLLEE